MVNALPYYLGEIVSQDRVTSTVGCALTGASNYSNSNYQTETSNGNIENHIKRLNYLTYLFVIYYTKCLI